MSVKAEEAHFSYAHGVSEYEVTLKRLRAATLRLIDTAGSLGPPDHLHQPSALPGWTRAHVLVHLARNATGLRNLLLSGRTGEALRMYASPESREADIRSGIGRPDDVILADLEHASTAFLVEAEGMPVERIEALVAFTSGAPDAPLVNARDIVGLRLSEVEVHHVDLDAGYEFADTPLELAGELLQMFMTRLAKQGCRFRLILDGDKGSPMTIETAASPVLRGAPGPALAWLTGRSIQGMRTDGHPLPTLPPFG
jgi:maleylpyruvate isomerase